jgi:hypothetical protein
MRKVAEGEKVEGVEREKYSEDSAEEEDMEEREKGIRRRR